MKTKLLRLLIVMTISVTALFALGMTASAATEYNINEGSVTISADGDYIISGTGEATTNTITVESGIIANITLAGVNIDTSSTGDYNTDEAGLAAFKIADGSGGNVTITLKEGTVNTLKSGVYCAGLQKNGGTTSGRLTIGGTGILNATGGVNGAGVGSGNSCECANVVIESGTITATSDENGGAGIGGGYDGDVSNITINGGTVTAEGGWMSAGIGAGVNGSASGIKINGGTINATGGSYGAGIGGGCGTWGATCDDISITGGNITATGGAYGGAGIGGGYASACTNITIENAVITATAVGGGNAIGGGSGYAAADVSSSQNAIIVATTSDTTTATVYGNPVITDDFTLPEGYTLVIPEGSTVTVAKDATFTNNGTVTNNCRFTCRGAFVNGENAILENNLLFTSFGDFENNGTIANNNDLNNSGAFTNNGNITNTSASTFSNEIKGVITNNSTGTITNESGATIENKNFTGSAGIVNNGTIDNSGSISNGANSYGGSVIENNGDITNSGEITNMADCQIYNTSSGTITNESSGTIENNGTVTNSGNIVNNGTVEDNGEIIGNQPYAEAGDFIVTGGTKGTDYEYADGVLIIKTATSITIANKTPENATTDRIEVATGVSADITLAGVNIDTLNASGAAFMIADNSIGNVTITLADGKTNTLKSGTDCAGLQKNGEYSETLGKLTITGTGTLTATGGDYGAGIGGGREGSGSNIKISGGTVTATGGTGSAGIGGGYYYGGDGSYITISGGKVTATSSSTGAGIGGGWYGSGSNITISGGTVKAQGGYRAAGIGGGGGGSSSNIEISGGTVTATGGSGGSGIGGGWIFSGSDIKISGGVVTATGGEYGAGIGGGFEANGSNITISGGVVIANGGGGSNGGAGIGGGGSGDGSYGSGSNITINGGTVTATGSSNGAGIGGGGGGSTDNIKISGGSVKADTIGCIPTDGTANVTPVYPLEFDVDGTSAVTINGKAYPTKHIDENKLYVYLPAKTAQAPNEVTVGNETTKYCYINAKWLKVVDSPEADDTEFTYDGTEKTYTFAGSDYCTITGNKQTNAGTYTVTVALNDKVNTVWSDDGTTDDKTYEFVINKATPTAKMFTYTAPTDLDYDGNVKSATVTTDKDGMGDITIQYYKNGILTEPVECGIYSVKVSVAEGDNYTDATDLTADDWTFTINHVDADNNGYCDDCGAICDGIGAHLAGYTLSLNGSIGVNFHMDLTQDVLDDNEAYMLFTLPNGTTQKVMVIDAKAKESAVIEGKKYYIFTCNVAAKEMTDTIQAQLITSDGSKTQVYEYSVREYADRILSGSYDAETQELVKAMLHYGAYSQEWFDYNTTNLANEGLDTLDLSDADDWDGFDPIITNDENVGSFTSAYLTLESDTAINLKFKLADGVSFEDLRFVVEDTLGNVVPVTIDMTENVCLITLTGIKASDLDTMYDFSVTDKEGNESAILYSAMSYACAVANSEMDQKLKNVTAALRIFNLRANEKFEN